jgi:hypothetical protein
MSCMHLSYDSRGSTVRLQYWIAEAYDMPFLNTGLSNLKTLTVYKHSIDSHGLQTFDRLSRSTSN